MNTDLDILAEYMDESRDDLGNLKKIFLEIQKTENAPPESISDLLNAIYTVKDEHEEFFRIRIDILTA